MEFDPLGQDERSRSERLSKEDILSCEERMCPAKEQGMGNLRF